MARVCTAHLPAGGTGACGRAGHAISEITTMMGAELSVPLSCAGPASITSPHAPPSTVKGFLWEADDISVPVNLN